MQSWECLGMEIGDISYSQATEMYNYLIAQNECSEEAKDFAEAILDAGTDAEVDYVRNIIYTINKPCQKEIVENVMEVSSPLTTLIKETFDVSENVNVKFWNGDISSYSTGNAYTNPFNIGTSDNHTIRIGFSDSFLETGTDLSIVAVTLHELVHAYFYSLYISGSLVATNPEYETLLNAFVAFYANPTQPTFDIQDAEIHNAMEDFITQMANTIYNYALANNIEGVNANYCVALAWGTMLDTALIEELLTPLEIAHANNVMITEQNNTEYATTYPIKGTPCE